MLRARLLPMAVVGWGAAAQAQPPPVAVETGLPAESAAAAEDQPGLALRGLPLESRTDLIPYLQIHVPGVVPDGAGLSIQGGAAHENRYTADGLGVSRLRVPLILLGDLQVARAGYGADLGDVPGGLVAVQTRASGTRWRAGADAAQEIGDPDGQVVSAWAGGPVVGQRLLLVTALEVERTDRKGVEDYDSLALTGTPIERRGGKAGLKLVYLPGTNHRVELLGIAALGRQDNVLRLSSREVRLGDAQPRLQERYGLLGLRWLGRLGARVGAQAQVGVERTDDRETPLICLTRPDCDDLPRISTQEQGMTASNRADRMRAVTRTLESSGSVQVELPSVRGVQSSVRAGTRLRLQALTTDRSVLGNSLTGLVGPSFQPQTQTTWFANDPRLGMPVPGGTHREADGVQALQFIEASARVREWLEVRPGLGLVNARASVADQRLTTMALTHHLSAAAVLHSGRQIGVRATTHRRVDADVGHFAGLLTPAPWSQVCTWNATTSAFDRDCRITGGDLDVTRGLPCGSHGLADDGSPCRRQMSAPRVWEHTLGAGGQLGWGLRLDVDLVDRRTHGLWTTTETNRIWTVVGRSASFTGDYRNGRPGLVTDLSPSAGEGRRHRAVTTTLAHGGGDLRFAVAHTYSRTREHTQPLVGMVIDQDDGGRHFLHLQGSWRPISDLSLGVLAAYAQGLPLVRLVRSSVTGEYLPYGTPNYSDRRPHRLPSLKQASVQARVSLRRLARVDAQLYADFVNVMSADRYALVVQEDGLFFSTATGLIDDRFFRLGLQAEF